MNKEPTGTIFLPTWSAIALWEHEIRGQLSDGMWENAAPHDHWKFWNALNVELATGGANGRVVTDRAWMCKKVGYNFAALFPIVGERMVAIGRTGQSLCRRVTYDEVRIAERHPLAGAYDLKSLKQDIALIKLVMKTVPR